MENETKENSKNRSELKRGFGKTNTCRARELRKNQRVDRLGELAAEDREIARIVPHPVHPQEKAAREAPVSVPDRQAADRHIQNHPKHLLPHLRQPEGKPSAAREEHPPPFLRAVLLFSPKLDPDQARDHRAVPKVLPGPRQRPGHSATGPDDGHSAGPRRARQLSAETHLRFSRRFE